MDQFKGTKRMVDSIRPLANNLRGLRPSLPHLGELENIITRFEAEFKEANPDLKKITQLAVKLEPAIYGVMLAVSAEGDEVQKVAAEIPKCIDSTIDYSDKTQHGNKYIIHSLQMIPKVYPASGFPEKDQNAVQVLHDLATDYSKNNWEEAYETLKAHDSEEVRTFMGVLRTLTRKKD